ncbi:hypothetical protein C0992_010821, partial [Termitomyces sp. T32_za158]
APTSLSLDDQLADLLGDNGGLTLWTEISPNSTVDMYVWPLVELDLDQQAQIYVEAAKQRMAEGQVAGFLAPETSVAGASTVSPSAGTETAVEAAEALLMETLEAAVEEELAEEDMDNEDNVPSTPKRSKAVGKSNLMPTVGKRVSKSTTLSKHCMQKAEKVVPQYE